MKTKIDALRELWQIVKGHDYLVHQAHGVWTFDVDAAYAAAGDSPPLTEAKDMNEDVSNTEHSDANVQNSTHATSETVSLEGLTVETVEYADATTATGTAPLPETSPTAKPAKVETDRQREKRETKERNKAARDERKAKKEADKSQKQSERDAARAQREADDAAKEVRKATRKANAQANRDKEEANRVAREQAQTAREANKRNKVYKPAEGGTLAKLWAVIDALAEEQGHLPSYDEYAAKLVGTTGHGTPLTQTTAYYNYRRYHGIKVRGTTVDEVAA